jgi:hypothetical protein
MFMVLKTLDQKYITINLKKIKMLKGKISRSVYNPSEDALYKFILVLLGST